MIWFPFNLQSHFSTLHCTLATWPFPALLMLFLLLKGSFLGFPPVQFIIAFQVPLKSYFPREDISICLFHALSRILSLLIFFIYPNLLLFINSLISLWLYHWTLNFMGQGHTVWLITVSPSLHNTCIESFQELFPEWLDDLTMTKRWMLTVPFKIVLLSVPIGISINFSSILKIYNSIHEFIYFF